jgi:hypothetical protein
VIGPSVAEERARSLRARGLPAEVVWKSNGPILSAVFFVLTALAVAALAVLLDVLKLPHVLTAAGCFVVAELLIVKKRFFGTGIESALWAGALVSLILMLPNSGRVEAFLVFALAAAIVGFRMRNPFFGTVAAILVVAYAAAKWKVAAWPIVAGCAIGVTAAIALGREWKRESTEDLFAALAIVLPAAGYIASLEVDFAKSRWWIAMSFALAGAAAMFAAIRLRHRFLLIAAFLAIAIAGFEARDLLAATPDVKRIIAGLLLIAIARAVAYALRDRKTGFVVTPSSMSGYDEAIQIIGTVAVAPRHAAPAEGGPAIESGGSSFGGAGTGGGY